MSKLPPTRRTAKRPSLDALSARLAAAVELELPPAPTSAVPTPLPDRSAELERDLSSSRRIRRTAQRVKRDRARKRELGYVDRLARAHAKDRAWLERHRKRMADRRGEETKPPPGWGRELWRDCQDVLYDLTGKAARVHLARLRYPAWSSMIRRAALGEVDGVCTRDWSSERARAIVCVGLALCRSAQRTRGLKWCFLVRGFTREAFAELVRGARARRPHANTIGGIHRKGAPAFSGQLGYLQALQAFGLCYRQRTPLEQAESWERWKVTRRQPDGSVEEMTVTTNRYWLANPNPYDGRLDEDLRLRLAELAATAADSRALHLRPRPPRPSSAPPAPPLEPAPPD